MPKPIVLATCGRWIVESFMDGVTVVGPLDPAGKLRVWDVTDEVEGYEGHELHCMALYTVEQWIGVLVDADYSDGMLNVVESTPNSHP